MHFKDNNTKITQHPMPCITNHPTSRAFILPSRFLWSLSCTCWSKKSAKLCLYTNLTPCFSANL